MDSPHMDATMFYIGQHETKRTLPVSPELLHHAQDLGVSVDAQLALESPPLT